MSGEFFNGGNSGSGKFIVKLTNEEEFAPSLAHRVSQVAGKEGVWLVTIEHPNKRDKENPKAHIIHTEEIKAKDLGEALSKAKEIKEIRFKNIETEFDQSARIFAAPKRGKVKLNTKEAAEKEAKSKKKAKKSKDSTPKKGRGRPKKTVDSKEASSSKKKRGRPRKTVEVSAEPKRGRGRPKKTLEAAPVLEKKKRGRPKKVEEVEVKRGRGRPKKEATVSAVKKKKATKKKVKTTKKKTAKKKTVNKKTAKKKTTKKSTKKKSAKRGRPKKK